MDTPFRWDISRREQLGRLAAGEAAESYPGFIDDLRACAARVLAQCGDADLVFVGRSPESLFDYLSGALDGTSWRERLDLLNLSLRDVDEAELRIGAGPDVRVLRRHLAALALTPREIASRPRPIALVDLVASGRTFEVLARALAEWAREEAFDWPAARRRLRFIGITWQTHTSPNTWRWQQNAGWTAEFAPSAVKNVSIPGNMWDYLGNTQPKVARSQPQWRWRDESWRLAPPREAANLASLRLALHVFETAHARGEQLRFARLLAEQPALSRRWFRALIAEIRRK